MRSIKILFSALLIPLFAFTTAHKFYVSVTQVEYIKEKQSVQIIARVFIDDFEELLRKRYDENITLDVSKDESTIDTYIKKYLFAKIQIEINGDFKKLKFLGKEYEDDIMYCYLEITDVEFINSFRITNQLLFDVFEEQQNIVKTNINSKRKSFMLTPNNDSGVLNFN
ncbi:MAG: peptidase E [Chlorobi bacterium]|nr:peptidase E [Chlorobiota bacterium]